MTASSQHPARAEQYFAGQTNWSEILRGVQNMGHVDETVLVVNQRRSERIVLEVPVIITTETEEGETLQDEAYSRVVNAHGGLLTVHFELQPDQTIMLTNPKLGMFRQGRVVRCTRASSHEFSMAFAFARPSPEFWPGYPQGND
jgi:hypothetical protein